MMESEVIVEVTEFDNLRNEYLQQEANSNDYISMLKAQMTAEYKAIHEEDPEEAESYLNEAKTLIAQLCAWRDSVQHQKDIEFRAGIEALVRDECQKQSFALREDDSTRVYLAGDSKACLHLGNDTDSVRLIYTRDGIAECVHEAVSQLRTKRETREKEILDTLRSMQNALVSARTNTLELDVRRVRRVFYSSMVGIHSAFVDELIASASVATQRKDRKWSFSPTTDTRYYEFMKSLTDISTPLVMAGQGKTPLFRFVLSIPQEGELRISWDSYKCKNYLYSETFKVNEPYDDKLRRWWSQSCLLELKRLKDLEALQQEYSQTTKL